MISFSFNDRLTGIAFLVDISDPYRTVCTMPFMAIVTVSCTFCGIFLLILFCTDLLARPKMDARFFIISCCHAKHSCSALCSSHILSPFIKSEVMLTKHTCSLLCPYQLTLHLM